MAGQTINDRLLAARHSLAGQGLAKSVCKATTEEMIAPKKKHLDCKSNHNFNLWNMSEYVMKTLKKKIEVYKISDWCVDLIGCQLSAKGRTFLFIIILLFFSLAFSILITRFLHRSMEMPCEFIYFINIYFIFFPTFVLQVIDQFPVFRSVCFSLALE